MKDFITAILIRPGEPPKMGTQTLGEALHTIKKEHDRMEQFIAVNIPDV